MPGTIQVSVLEFQPPQEPSSVSEMFLKISMGKKEYQTLDKGDFSFPLISLRDNLIVILGNAEGKEISHSVVDTKVVISKGVWDNLFPFEGGGYVHMKLQFILSEKDRHRIRIMRELALKKKHDELLKSEVTSLKKQSIVRSYSESSLMTNQEVSDSHKSLLRNEVIQAILPSTSTTFAHFKTQSSTEKELNPNDTDRLVERTSFKVPAETNFVKEASSPGSSGSVLSGEIQTDKNLFEKNPSKIRNMISAFETSLVQDMKPKIRPPSSKSQLSGKEIEFSSRSVRVNEVDIKNPIHMTKREEKTKTSFVQPTDFSSKGLKSSEGFARELTGEKASVSGKMVGEKHKQTVNKLVKRRVSGENLLRRTNKKEIEANNLEVENCERTLADESCSSEHDGAWIFPDGGKGMCITAGGKQIMDLTGGFHLEAKKRPEKMSSEVENVKKVKEGGSKAPRRHEKSNNEDSERSRRPVGKVMRVAIMFGFATLVFFTRQRS